MKLFDNDRLRHMLEAAREAVSFAHGQTQQDLVTDRKLLLAIVKAVEIVGEAASKVSLERRSTLPEISWKNVIGMRNILTHGYFDWDVETIWEVTHLPELIPHLERALIS